MALKFGIQSTNRLISANAVDQFPTIIRGTIIRFTTALSCWQSHGTAQARRTATSQPEPGVERAFGDALREIRKEHGISQEQLALDSGLDRTYVSLIERGAQSPTIRSVLKVAGVLGVKPSAIILRMEEILSKKSRPHR